MPFHDSRAELSQHREKETGRQRDRKTKRQEDKISMQGANFFISMTIQTQKLEKILFQIG